MNENTPAPAGGSDIKVPILIGAVVALLGANIYLYTQIDKLKADVADFRKNMSVEVASLKESSAVSTQTARRSLTSLKDELELSSIMQAPKVSKITLNMGVGEAKTDAKALDAAIEELSTIAGQRAQVRRARKSIASFKLREGMSVGARVTLRGARMYEFLDRFITVALPRVRDFRGVNGKSFDGRGNYNIGVKEQIIFPEIDYDKIDALRGMNISITTTAKTDEEAKALLAAFKFPFRN